MKVGVFRVVFLAAAAVLAAGCGPVCTPKSGGTTAFATLDEWCQVSMVNGDILPIAGMADHRQRVLPRRIGHRPKHRAVQTVVMYVPRACF